MATSVALRGMETETDPYLGGAHAPVHAELEVDRLRVHGRIPPELDGTFLQVGSNPRFAPRGDYHWFDGDGMVHAVTFREGRAAYRNRWIRTEDFEREGAAGRCLSSGIREPLDLTRPGGPLKETANTDVVMHRGRLLALWWIAGRAYRLDPRDLRTLGVEDFGGVLPRRIAAHPKVDPRTGGLVFLDWHPLPPWLCIGEIGADGTLAHYIEVPLPGPRLQHDLALTPHFVVVLDAPLLLEPAAMATGRFELEFHRELPLRVGLVPRRASGAGEVRWFEAEPGYVFHIVNAWEEEQAVIVHGCRIAEPLVGSGRDDVRAPRLGGMRLAPTLHRWRLDLRNGSVTEADLDDRFTEFPRTDDRALGQRARFSLHPRIARRDTLLFDGLIRYDIHADRTICHDYPRGWFGGEACLVPDVHGATDGWIVVYVTDERRGRSEVHVLEPAELQVVARIDLPQRIPAGFHTRWIPGEDLRAGARSGTEGVHVARA
jgi:carotenoid cleavage dioxygenase-like enzyme